MDIKVGDKVSLVIGMKTHLGYTVLIDETYEGLLYRNEIFQEIQEGQHIAGYIKNIREDGKIDVSLRPQGFKNVIDQDTDTLLDLIYEYDGFLPLTDKSSPEEIKEILLMSKKAFKRAVGSLFKEKKIKIESNGIRLVS